MKRGRIYREEVRRISGSGRDTVRGTDRSRGRDRGRGRGRGRNSGRGNSRDRGRKKGRGSSRDRNRGRGREQRHRCMAAVAAEAAWPEWRCGSRTLPCFDLCLH